MASVNLTGTLTNPEGEPDEGAIVKFTLLTTTGTTVSSSKSQLEVPQDGLYDIDIVYGNLRVDYINEDGSTRFVAIVTVNGDTVATSLPELLNAAVPPTNAQLLEFQGILADAVTAQVAAEAAETGAVAAEATLLAEKLTTVQLIALSNTFAVGSVIDTLGYTSNGDGGGAQWVKSGISGSTPSQSPAQKGGAVLSDGSGDVWALVYEYKIELEKLGFITATAQQRTGLVQGLSDSLSNVEIYTPEGDYTFAASSLVETWPNASAGTVAASGCAVVVRENIKYSGAGRDLTSWSIDAPAKTIVFIDNGTNTEITGIEFKNTYTGIEAGAGHGLFNLVKQLDDTVTNLNIHHIRCKNVASYGVGLNYGYQTKCTLNDIQTDATGSDGIDIKSRATSTLVNNANSFIKIHCNNFGLRLSGSVGLDIRGECSINDCWFTGFGDGTSVFTGLRLRPVDATTNNLSIRTVATNIHVVAANGTNTTGIQISGEDNSVIGFSVTDCDIGISMQEATACNLVGGTISGHNTNAINTTTSATDISIASVFALNAGTATNHFRIEGSGATFRGVDGDNSAGIWSLGTAANNSVTRDSPKTRVTDGLDVYQITAGRVGLQAKGVSTNIDLALTPKGTGKLRVGTHEVIAAETATGFIRIRDSGGVERKIAIVS